VAQKQESAKFYQRAWVRIAIITAGLLVVLASFWVTNQIAEKFKIEERKRVELYADATRIMAMASDEAAEICDFTLHSEIQASNTTIPIILTDEGFRVIDVLNYEGRELKKDKIFFEQQITRLRRDSQFVFVQTPLFKQYVFYENSTLIEALEWFPYIQLALLTVFILFIYLSWAASRQAEQERVWVGMAKETAHQLGTPITSLVGWVENLKAMYENDDYILMVASEINKDIRLLEIVAERFSKMGAVPELKATNIIYNLDRYHQYIRQRASRKIVFDFPSPDNSQPVFANINTLLFDWVIENLLKNALDAMDSQGSISVKAWNEAHWACIEITDTGKGMPRNLFKQVFKPGFSTKKRGWGLGLSLCKRIIETYHKGKIFVHSSVVGEGTTFRILLPAAKLSEITITT
jgi:signal transduction histidine kinase